MKVLDIEFSVAEMMDVISSGYPAYSWSKLPNKKEVGNFYKTISVVPNNIGPSEKLFFRTYKFGKTAKDDVKGPTHQATHFHIPLFNFPGIVAAEYVTGFPLEAVDGKPTGLANFGQFAGLQDGNIGPFVVFSESSVTASDTDQNDEVIDMGMSAEPTILPTEIPTALMPLVKTGHQLFWSAADSKFYPYQIHFLYNSKIYFKNKFPSFNEKFRALYFLERMTPIVEGESDFGKGLIVGFSVSVDTGQSLRGLGSLSLFDSELVSFVPSA